LQMLSPINFAALPGNKFFSWMRYVQKAIKRCLPRSAWSLGLLVKQRRKKKFHKLIIQQNMCANGKSFKNSQRWEILPFSPVYRQIPEFSRYPRAIEQKTLWLGGGHSLLI
jgi:hypothetical protein